MNLYTAVTFKQTFIKVKPSFARLLIPKGVSQRKLLR